MEKTSGEKLLMDIGLVRLVDIDTEMRGSYLDYAMSVIVSRALPDARDGLKPVHRRILYAIYDMGLRANSPYKKSARIVGEVLGKYHPHGDTAVYDAMARMAQDFSMRYPLVDGQGNFGSIDGDSPAAMRYTEARLSAIAEELLLDIDKDTVDFADNFDASLKEPVVLPGKLPNLLINGASGIAVGMATNMPPHNLGEICDAVAYVIDHYDQVDEVSVEDLMQFVPGPDFPTAGIILGGEGIRTAYATGKGRIVVRAQTQIEEMKGGRYRIQVTQIPFQVNKSALLERIAELVRSDRIDGIADLRDESDREGLSVVIELKRGAQPHKVLNQLLKYTPLQTSFTINMLALWDGEPRLISLRRALQIYIEHRQEVITRRSQYELDKARHRAHILEGLLIALQYLDEVIALIRQAPDAAVAHERLMERFGLSDIQAQAILDMQLRRLAALERDKIEQEHAKVLETIAHLEDLLAHPQKILGLIKGDVLFLKEKYGDQRRTLITAELTEDFSHEDLIQDEEVLISITQRGYIKRVLTKTYRRQGRGGQGVIGMATREEDTLFGIFTASTLDDVLFFSNQGRVFRQRIHHLPEAERQARGLPLINILALGAQEQVTAAVPIPAGYESLTYHQPGYFTMVTAHGAVKRIKLAEFASVRPSGLIAIGLAEGDSLGWVKLTRGDQDILIVSDRGKAIRFHEGEIRPSGRAASGVRALRLAEGDRVTSVETLERLETGAESAQGDLLLVTVNGYGKRVSLSEYPVKHRGGGGITTLSPAALKFSGGAAATCIVSPGDEVLLISAQGMVLRVDAGRLRLSSRTARGVTVMSLKEGDRVVAVTRLKSQVDMESPEKATADENDGAESEFPPPPDGNGHDPGLSEANGPD